MIEHLLDKHALDGVLCKQGRPVLGRPRSHWAGVRPRSVQVRTLQGQTGHLSISAVWASASAGQLEWKNSLALTSYVFELIF